MSADDVMLVVGWTLLALSLAWVALPRIRRHIIWKREFKDIVAQIEHGIETGNDAHVSAGLARLRILSGLPPREDT
jgi:hypothetical protein